MNVLIITLLKRIECHLSKIDKVVRVFGDIMITLTRRRRRRKVEKEDE